MSGSGNKMKGSELTLEEGWELYKRSCEKARKMLVESRQFNFSEMTRAQAYTYIMISNTGVAAINDIFAAPQGVVIPKIFASYRPGLGDDSVLTHRAKQG